MADQDAKSKMASVESLATQQPEQAKKRVTLDKVILAILLVPLWSLFIVPFILFYSFTPKDSDSEILSNGTGTEAAQLLNITANDTSCLPDFYFDTSKNYCLPHCYSWRSYSQTESVILDVVLIFSCCLATLMLTAILVISCVRRKKVLKFPPILVVYMSVTILPYYASVLIGYTRRYKLYCLSMNLLDNFTSATPFCIITGALVDYVTLQVLIWWLSHIISVFFLLFYPLRAKLFLKSRKIRYVHATVVLVALLAPTIPILITLLLGVNQEDNEERLGYRVFLYPTMTCGNARSTVHFYTVNVPNNILITTGVTFLLFIFWKLFNHQRDKFQISTAEKKVLLSFIYFTMLQISSSTFSVYWRNIFTDYRTELMDFFTCAQHSMECEKPDLVYSVWISVLSYAVYACLPVFLLVYVINFEKLAQCLREKKHSITVAFKK